MAYLQERPGDAQTMTALGRVFGLLIDGALLANGSSVALGIVAAVIIASAALFLLNTDRRNLPLRRSPTPSPVRTRR
jgi:hypothetical protein